MDYEIIIANPFKKDLKKLSKKYRSINNDLKDLVVSLKENPTQGIQIRQNCYKIRLAIQSKGKSSGARVITYAYVDGKTVYLLSIFDKSDKGTISDKELEYLLEEIKE